MIVDAEVYYWTPEGMQRRPRLGGPCERYIKVADAERLLEEADARRREAMREETDDLKNEIRELRQ